MSSEDIIISARQVSKCYEMYDKPIHRLFQTLTRGRKTFYKEFWALRNIDLEVKRGECVGIIGKNGAGKSTLLQILTGTLQSTSGSIEIKGRVAALLELGSGFNMEFTGRENVYMNAAILGLSQEEIAAKYPSIVEFADIGEFIDQPVKTYSSGMLVRLAFAVVAHVDADILIVDEALAVGDAFFTQKCMRFIRKFREEHTILFVSHDTASVINLCDRAILLDKGEIIAQGPAKDIADQYLCSLYAANQNVEGPQAAEEAPAEEEEEDEVVFRDMRQNFVNASNFRNDIEIFRFKPDAENFGDHRADIILVQFTDKTGWPLAWCVGGEMVILEVTCKANEDVYAPIVGYYIRDHLGQELFGDNTCLTTLQTAPLMIPAGGTYKAIFEFRMPMLRNGVYSLVVATASGTQHDHVQHHWIYEAVVFESRSDSCCGGLMGIPHKRVSIEQLS